MGLAKSLRKANYLAGLANNLSNIAAILEEQKKRREREKFYQLAIDLYKQFKQKQDEIEALDNELKKNETSNNVLSPENLKNLNEENPEFYWYSQEPDSLWPEKFSNVNRPKRIEQNIILDNVLSNNVNDTKPPEPNIELQPEKSKELSIYEKYSKSQKNLMDFINALIPHMLNRNLDEATLSRANILTSLAESMTKSLKPKEPTFFDLSEGEARYAIDPYTNELYTVAKNVKIPKTSYAEIEKDENGNYKIYKIGGQKYYRRVVKDQNGNVEKEQLIRIPESKSLGIGVGIGEKNKKETKLPPQIADAVAELKTLKPYGYVDGDKVLLNEDMLNEKKTKAYEKIKFHLLKDSRAYQFVNNMEKLYGRYLTPQELANEAIKAAKERRLSIDAQEEIAKFLQIYNNDIYAGLTVQPLINEEE